MVKKIIFFIVGFMVVVFPLSSSHAFQMKKGTNCLDCHKLSVKEAQQIIDKVVPSGKVVDVKSSPIKGVWQIDVEKNTQRGAVYLDFSKKYLTAQIVPLDVVLKQQPQPRKVDVSKILLTDAIVLSSVDAKKKVIVFTDPDCPYCRELHKIMKQIITKRHDIAFYLILNPLPMHKDAYKRAQTILCTKSLAVLDDAFEGKAVAEPACPADAVERSKELAKSFEFDGTPTLVRDDGMVLTGYLPEDQLLDWIDKK
jgi:thiol:disulfide interchange protein DsbC